MTTFGDMVYGMGGVPLLPSIPFGMRSNHYFVAPYRSGSENGASDGNDGKTPRRALKTISAALSKCTEDENDVVWVIASGNSAAETTDDLTETLTWSKDLTHLIGVTPGNMFGGRARIGTQTTGITPLVNVTANGCLFQNIHVYHGVTSDQTGLIAVQVTGDRNVFRRCHFAGGGTSGTSDDAGMRSLKLSGAAECLFEDCVIGLDTTDRSTTANAELEFDNGSTVDGCARTVFRRCHLTTFGSGAHAMVIVDADGIDRYVLFDDCVFTNGGIQSGGSALNEVFACTASSSPAGAIILKDPLAYGCGPWEADVETGRVIVLGHPTPASTDGSGLAGAPESP